MFVIAYKNKLESLWDPDVWHTIFLIHTVEILLVIKWYNQNTVLKTKGTAISCTTVCNVTEM